MTGQEYREALIELGLTQAGFAAWIGVHPVTGKTWARRGPPKPIARWVQLLLANRRAEISPAEIERWKKAAADGSWKLPAVKVRQLIDDLERLRVVVDSPIGDEYGRFWPKEFRPEPAPQA